MTCETSIHRNIPTRVVKPFCAFGGFRSSECVGHYVCTVADWHCAKLYKVAPVMV